MPERHAALIDIGDFVPGSGKNPSSVTGQNRRRRQGLYRENDLAQSGPLSVGLNNALASSDRFRKEFFTARIRLG